MKTKMEFTDLNFRQDVLSCPEPVLVVIGTAWCGSYQVLDSILEKIVIAFSNKIRVGRLDVDDNRLTASLINCNEFPTLILFINGENIWQHVGLISLVDLINKLEDLLEKK